MSIPTKSPTPPKIITTHVYPPIPVRFMDWQAHYAGEEDEQMAHGSGGTEEEAIRDLMEKHPRSGNPCPACKKPFFDGDTCGMGGCLMGGDF